MKVAEITRRLTLVPPSENDDLKDGLERYHREHLFEPPGFITGKFARAAAFWSEIEQMSRRAESKARNAKVATNEVRTVAEAKVTDDYEFPEQEASADTRLLVVSGLES
jgi:hypothetical protein